MSGVGEAVRILIAADDEASSVFDRVESRVDSFAGTVERMGSGIGFKKVADAIVSIGGKLSIAALGVKALQSLADGAGYSFENSITRKIDSAGDSVFDLTTKVEGLFRQFSAQLPEGSWVGKIADYFGNVGPTFQFWGAQLRDIGAFTAGKQVPQALDPASLVNGMPRDSALKVLQGQRRSLLDQSNAITKGGSGILSEFDKATLAILELSMKNVNNYIATKLSADPNVSLNPRAPNGPAAAKFLTALGSGKSPFTTQFGQPKSIIQGLGERGQKEIAEKLEAIRKASERQVQLAEAGEELRAKMNPDWAFVMENKRLTGLLKGGHIDKETFDAAWWQAFRKNETDVAERNEAPSRRGYVNAQAGRFLTRGPGMDPAFFLQKKIEENTREAIRIAEEEAADMKVAKEEMEKLNRKVPEMLKELIF